MRLPMARENYGEGLSIKLEPRVAVIATEALLVCELNQQLGRRPAKSFEGKFASALFLQVMLAQGLASAEQVQNVPNAKSLLKPGRLLTLTHFKRDP